MMSPEAEASGCKERRPPARPEEEAVSPLERGLCSYQHDPLGSVRLHRRRNLCGPALANKCQVGSSLSVYCLYEEEPGERS